MFLVFSVVSPIPLQHTFFLFFFNDTATTEIYTLSLHDALPISLPNCVSLLLQHQNGLHEQAPEKKPQRRERCYHPKPDHPRSEEHTSELQSQSNLVCRLLLEKKKKQQKSQYCHDSRFIYLEDLS